MTETVEKVPSTWLSLKTQVFKRKARQGSDIDMYSAALVIISCYSLKQAYMLQGDFQLFLTPAPTFHPEHFTSQCLYMFLSVTCV